MSMPTIIHLALTMTLLDRRLFLAGTAAAAATPSFAAPLPSDVDVAIVGAGAAGIAAARRIAAAGRRCLLLEAADHVGGRCITDTRSFGVPFDRGAHWIHVPDLNPVAKLAAGTGLDIYPAPVGEKIRIGRRYAREGEMEDFLSALVRANRAIAEAARGRVDVPCAQALPKDLRDWRSTIAFVLGPYGCGKDLSDVSAMDFARSAERDVDAFCRQGLGTLLARLADGLPVQLGTAVKRINTWLRSGVEIETAHGYIKARAAIVTVSTSVLAANHIKFDPELPRRQLDAVNNLKLGSYDHIALELPGNPLGLERDDLVFEKSDGTKTAGILANVSGSPLAVVEVGGTFGRELAGEGEGAMVAFALDWLSNLYGTDLKKAVGRTATTQWDRNPWTLGAFSAAAPGGQPARRILMEPVRDRVWFAGEAVHETQWGTLGGAWESGERAAEAVMRKLGWVSAPREPRREPMRRR
jgi:monoamine oxidase